MLHKCQNTNPHFVQMTQYPTLHRWDAKSHTLLSQPALARGFKGHAQLFIFQKILVPMFLIFFLNKKILLFSQN